MHILLGVVFTTALLALAVKQFSYALTSGSLFDPLRRAVRKGMNRRVPGFRTLNELFTCKLCMTMQVAFWTVVVPSICLGFTANIAHAVVGLEPPVHAVTASIIIASILYGTAVSALALGLWIYLEYPAKRYEDTVYELAEANQKIEELQLQLARGEALAQVASTHPAINGNGSGNRGPIISLHDFRIYMSEVNHDCRGLGCGYSRRSCRQAASKRWLANWAVGSDERQRLLPALKTALGKALPDYFREHSDDDMEIEDERAFKQLHRQVVERLHT